MHAHLACVKVEKNQDSLRQEDHHNPTTAKGAPSRAGEEYGAHLSRFSTMRRALAATKMSIMRFRMPASRMHTRLSQGI